MSAQSGGVFPHIGQPVTFTALGKQWTAGRFTVGVWKRVWEWVKPRLPDQFAGLDRLADKMDKESFERLVREAQERDRAMNSLDCPEARQVLGTVEGGVVQFMEQLRENHPEITFDLAAEILADIGQQEAKRMKQAGEGEYSDAPKQAAPAA